jgi:hypothetical protein
MELALQLRYLSAADLRGHLHEHEERGALLLPLTEPPPELTQYAPVALEVVVASERCAMSAEVLQVLPGNGIVVRLTEVTQAAALVENAPIADPAAPPEVRIWLPELAGVTFVTGERPAVATAAVAEVEAALEAEGDAALEVVWEAEGDAALEAAWEAEGDAALEADSTGNNARGGTKPKVGAQIAGSSPVSWSLEQLQATWDQLTLPEKVRVARHGKRPARMLVLKGLDKSLHVHVLNNPGVTPEEIALMASMSSLEPTVLRRIAGDTQWLRHSAVARNLVCNPKLTLPQITRILKYVPNDELSRLARTGKVRQAVKQLIIKKLDRTR